MTDFVELRCELPDHSTDRLSELMGRYRVLGSVSEEIGGGRSEHRIYLRPGSAGQAIRLGELLVSMGAESVAVGSLEERDWLDLYRRSARPFRVGRRWWIEPRPESSAAAPEGRFRLTVEPSTAFGSGSHESTQLILMELEELPIRNATVLDAGTGSGILAIAATALGARLVMAFDLDPEAVWTARRGVRSDRAAGRMMLAVAPIAAIRGRFDNVLCNMVSGQLRELLPDLAAATEDRGRIVLSGILDDERAAVTASLRGVGLRVEGERRLGEWIAFRACHA